jgi:hypothetical protein
MTLNQRAEAVSKFGFTTRQARFLVTVMLHGGVCVPRQYACFVGTAYGQNVNEFFDKLVMMRFAVRCRCVHNRAAVYQVRHAALYRAIGEPHSRNRKPVPAARVVSRLMLLDAVTSHPEMTWLATRSDKVAYFSAANGCDRSRWPQRTVSGKIRYFPELLPIGVSPAGQIVLVFLADTSPTDGLKTFLQRHSGLLGGLPMWTFRLVLPPHLAFVKAWLEGVVCDEISKLQLPLAGRIESEVLPFSYRHLSPLTNLVRQIAKRVEEGERSGEHTLARPQPPQFEHDADDSTLGEHDLRMSAKC